MQGSRDISLINGSRSVETFRKRETHHEFELPIGDANIALVAYGPNSPLSFGNSQLFLGGTLTEILGRSGGTRKVRYIQGSGLSGDKFFARSVCSGTRCVAGHTKSTRCPAYLARSLSSLRRASRVRARDGSARYSGWTGQCGAGRSPPRKASATRSAYLAVVLCMLVSCWSIPLRKRLRILKLIGPTRDWFRVHMMLGVAATLGGALPLQLQRWLDQQPRRARVCASRRRQRADRPLPLRESPSRPVWAQDRFRGASEKSRFRWP